MYVLFNLKNELYFAIGFLNHVSSDGDWGYLVNLMPKSILPYFMSGSSRRVYGFKRICLTGLFLVTNCVLLPLKHSHVVIGYRERL